MLLFSAERRGRGAEARKREREREREKEERGRERREQTRRRTATREVFFLLCYQIKSLVFFSRLFFRVLSLAKIEREIER